MQAPDLSMTRISQDSSGELEFGFRQRASIRIGKAWNRIIAGIEAIGIDTAQVSRGRLAASTLGAILYPNRRVATCRIEGLDGRLVFPVDDPVDFAAEHVAQLLGHPLIDCQRRGFGRRRHNGWRRY